VPNNFVLQIYKMTEEYFDKHAHILCYESDYSRAYIAYNLLTHSGEIFKGARCIKEVDRLKRSTSNGNGQLLYEEIHEFIFDSLVDKARIIICFENYIKGILIEHGYIAHKLTGAMPGHKQLKQHQSKQPVRTCDIFNSTSFDNLDQKSEDQIEVAVYTLPFSTLLRKGYTDVAGLPIAIIQDLTELNQERNKLHFTSSTTFEYCGLYTARYDRLNTYFDETILPTIYHLQRKLEMLRGA